VAINPIRYSSPVPPVQNTYLLILNTR